MKSIGEEEGLDELLKDGMGMDLREENGFGEESEAEVMPEGESQARVRGETFEMDAGVGL